MDLLELDAVSGISISGSKEEDESIRKGTWSVEEDSILINNIAIHGEGRWNHLARNAGLKRTGRSCRMRWKNYLRPNVRRGNFTPKEQLRIMQLHCCYGNRWSKIAEWLPGRTDNEIKNYWRTRVHKVAKLLKCDINSVQFSQFILNTWLPTLAQQIQASYDYESQHFDDDTMNNYDSVGFIGPKTLQMDNWAGPIEANHISNINDLSGLDCGPDLYCSPFVGYGFDSPAWICP